MPAHWHRLPHFSGQCMPMHVAAYSHIHWHVLRLCFWAAQGDMWPRKVSVNCMRLHLATHSGILPPLGHVAQKSRGTICQYMGLHTYAHICMFSILSGHMAQTSRGQLCQCMGRLHGHTFYQYCSGPHGLDK